MPLVDRQHDWILEALRFARFQFKYDVDVLAKRFCLTLPVGIKLT